MVLIVVLAGRTGYVIGRDDGDDSGCSTETLAVPVSDGSIYEDVCVPPMLDALEPMDTSECGPWFTPERACRKGIAGLDVQAYNGREDQLEGSAMRHHQGRTALLGVLVVIVTTLGTAIAAPAGADRKPKVTVEIAPTATLAEGGQAVIVEVTASCPRNWQVLEALVTVSQPQASGMGFFPLTCTGRSQTFTVTVRSFGAAFEPGEALASAFLLILRRDQTQQAQDSAVLQILPAG
jgi:hypothetical protein